MPRRSPKPELQPKPPEPVSTNEPGPTSSGVASLVSELTAKEPPITVEPTVIQEAAAKLNEPKPEPELTPNSPAFTLVTSRVVGGPAGVIDIDGVPFNPELHERNPDTKEPVKTTEGRWRRKRGGGAKKAAVVMETAAKEAAAKSFDYRGNAEFLCTLIFGGLGNLGKCWEPTDKERSSIESASAKYLEANAIADVPPGIALCLCFGMYAMPRIFHPETKETVGNIVAAVTGKPPPKPAPQPQAAPRRPEPEPKSMSTIPRGNNHSPLDNGTAA